MDDDDRMVYGGQFYGRRTPGSKLEPVGESAPGPVDAWICRRVADYAPSPVPAGAAFTDCSKCGARIAFNPARKLDAPKICMQCASIEPLPIES